MIHNGAMCHDTLTKSTKQKLGFNQANDYTAWKESVKEKFIELFGIDVIKENVCEPQFTIEEEVQKERYKQVRFSFYSETDAYVPCYLLIPD